MSILSGLVKFCLDMWTLGTFVFFFFQAEDGIRDLVRSRGLGDVYKRQDLVLPTAEQVREAFLWSETRLVTKTATVSLHSNPVSYTHLTLPTSDLV